MLWRCTASPGQPASGPFRKSVEGSLSGSRYQIRSGRLLRHPRIRPAPIGIILGRYFHNGLFNSITWLDTAYGVGAFDAIQQVVYRLFLHLRKATGVKRNRRKTCKLCKRPTSVFPRSHSIPASFFRKLRGSDPNSVFFDLTGRKIVRRVQAGVWDDDMLCLECEGKFSDFDSYGWKILGELDLSSPYLENFQLAGYWMRCDTDKLRRFILSVLWRASVSKCNFYDRANLGLRQERQAIERIFDPTLLTLEEYPTLIFKRASDFLGEYTNLIWPPMTSRLKSGGLMCDLFLPELKITVFMGDTSSLWKPELFFVNKRQEFCMPFLTRDFAAQEFEYLRHVKRKYQSLVS
jgi:hypothetical protein